MKTRMLVVAAVVGTGLSAASLAQTAGAGEDDSVTDRTPLENVGAGAVQQRAPGNLVRAAIGVHAERAAARLAAQRGGDASELSPELTPTTPGSSGNSLIDLLGNLLGGMGGLGDLSGLLGGLEGAGIAGRPPDTGGPSDTGVIGTGTGAPGAGAGAIPGNLPPEALALLEANGFNVGDLTARAQGAAAAGDKPGGRQQTTPEPPTIPEQEPKFITRWANAMLQTLFTALAVGVSTPDFVDLLVEALTPPEASDDGGNGNGDEDDGEPVDVPRDPNSVVLGGPWTQSAALAA